MTRARRCSASTSRVVRRTRVRPASHSRSRSLPLPPRRSCRKPPATPHSPPKARKAPGKAVNARGGNERQDLKRHRPRLQVSADLALDTLKSVVHRLGVASEALTDLLVGVAVQVEGEHPALELRERR